MLDALVTVPTTSCAPVMAVVAASCVRPTTLGALTCGKPVDTVSATALPTTTSAPAAGDWLMTVPAGTVMLEVMVIAPTVRPTFVNALDALACGWPVTRGTATCGRPDEITSATALPTTTSAPAAGFWLITEPDGTVMLDLVLIAPTVRPMLVSALDAFACGWFVSSGTATCGRPEEITSATALPTTTSVPAVGFWLITEPDGTVMLELVLIAPTVRPMLVSALDAFACGWFVSSGTATCGRPEEITSATALPTTTSAPAAGF